MVPKLFSIWPDVCFAIQFDGGGKEGNLDPQTLAQTFFGNEISSFQTAQDLKYYLSRAFLCLPPFALGGGLLEVASNHITSGLVIFLQYGFEKLGFKKHKTEIRFWFFKKSVFLANSFLYGTKYEKTFPPLFEMQIGLLDQVIYLYFYKILKITTTFNKFCLKEVKTL